MKYRIYIETDELEFIDECDYEEMLFCLEYAIRVLHFDKKIIITEYRPIYNYETIFYIYDGNINNFKKWYENNSTGRVKK